MRNKAPILLTIILLLLSILLHFFKGVPQTVLSPVFTGLAIFITLISLFYKKSSHQSKQPVEQQNSDPAKSALVVASEKQVSADTAVVQISTLGIAHRRGEWQSIESQVDQLIDNCIKIIRSHIQAHTIGVFFPTADGGLKLRRYFSNSEHINKDAIIYPGKGVIGSFLKDGLKQLNLQEIVSDSMTLYYYNQDVGIRSLMASPISAGSAKRGSIIVDSTDKNHFSDEDHAFLSVIASVLGTAVYNTYLYTEHKLEHTRLAAMSSIEKEFFKDLSLNSILDKMVQIIPFAVPCDRLTISLISDCGTFATIKRVWGTESEFFLDKKFSLREKTIASLGYSKNICLSRNFSKDHYEVRYFDDEPKEPVFNSFLAVPVGVDTCKGLLFLESLQHDTFGEWSHDLLARMATSAGLALEKILVYEKVNNLATHDGLTGLNNHREFQQILKDEITRSIRYNDPLSLVICDIDYFKKVNDTYGHQFGDIVLKSVATTLDNSIRQGVDAASRYGGEEFALVLVKADQNSAFETAERIRQLIASKHFRGPAGEDVQISMSFGIAVYRQHAKHIDELIKKADKALYRAKENGRNRVEIF